MNAPTPAPAVTETAQIEEQLHALISAIVERDAQPRTARDRGPERFKALSLGEITAAVLDDLHPGRTKAERFVRKLRDEPVREALCYAVRQLGERLYEIGGLNAMQEACDRVSERDEASWSRRVNIMDKRWDGVGQSGASAGWVA